MSEIEVTHKILTENLGYIFVDEFSRSGSDINLYKYRKVYISGGSYTYQDYSFYGNYKTGLVSTMCIDLDDIDNFNKIKKEFIRENSLNLLLD